MPSMLMQHGVVESGATLVDAFDRDGFVLVESLLDARQLAEAQRGVQWAMANVAGNYKWIKQRTYEWTTHPIFAELIEHPFVLEFGRALLGGDFHLIAAQCSRNTREELYAQVTTIHQDGCFFPAADRVVPVRPLIRYSFSAMFYLQDTPLEMGPTECVPGLHRTDRQITNADITEGMLWRRAIPAGSLLLFNHRCWHRGAENHTDNPRDLITTAYALPMIEKSHLTVKDAGGREAYAEPAEVIRAGSDATRMLYRAR